MLKCFPRVCVHNSSGVGWAINGQAMASHHVTLDPRSAILVLVIVILGQHVSGLECSSMAHLSYMTEPVPHVLYLIT